MTKFLQFSCVISCLALSACAPTITNHGYNSEKIQVSMFKVGQTNQDQVMQELGSPSTISAFKEPIWYYVSKTTSTKSFFKPDVTDQQTLALTFTESGILKEMKIISKDESKDVKIVEDRTEPKGYDTGLLREVFGNFGRRWSAKPSSK